MTHEPLRHIIFLLAGVIIAGCQSTDVPPVTQQEAKPTSTPRENGLKFLADQRLLRLKNVGVLVNKKPLKKYIAGVGREVIPSKAREEISFSFHVVDSPVPNAFAMANGAIFVHSGLLSRLQNEAQLAMILAHESIHVIERHILEHLADMENKLGTLELVGILTAPAGNIGRLTYVLGELVTVAAVYGFNRDLEREADRKGLTFLTRSKYASEQAPNVFHLLNLQLDRKRNKVPYLYATHPRNRERRRYLQERIGDQELSETGVKRTERYMRKTSSIRKNVVKQNIDRFWPKTARYELELSTLKKPGHPELYYRLAQTFFFAEDPDYRNALHFARKAHKNGFEDPEVLLFLGRVHQKLSNYARARKRFESYLEENPNAPRRPMIRAMIDHAKNEK